MTWTWLDDAGVVRLICWSLVSGKVGADSGNRIQNKCGLQRRDKMPKVLISVISRLLPNRVNNETNRYGCHVELDEAL